MDAPVLSRLCGQPGAAATVRAGLQPGQLPAAGHVAPGGASLDIDDVAGETDQDWGEGRAPFPEDRLLDENNKNHGGGVFSSGIKKASESKKASEHPRCQRKTETGLGKRLAN